MVENAEASISAYNMCGTLQHLNKQVLFPPKNLSSNSYTMRMPDEVTK